MRLNELTIKEARAKLDSGEISAVALAQACLDRIREADSKIKACLTVCEKQALVAAAFADEQIKKGARGGLLGIPYLAKDNIMTRGVRTTAASKILDDYIAPFDATVIKKLNQSGAILLGKTNLDEFAHGASTENSAFGPTHNPWDISRVPGGSSGGSAAAVASDMCIFALGTDTGGSIRCPASFCGVAGLKPTYGRASRFGLVAMTSSTDVPGPLAKTAEDARIVLEIISGPDGQDATVVGDADGKERVKKELSEYIIGVPKEYFGSGLDERVAEAMRTAIEKYKALGVKFIDISLPHTKYGVPVYYIITPSEVSSNLARFDGIKYGYSVVKNNGDDSIIFKNLLDVYQKSRGRGFGPEAKRRIMLGTYALSAGYYDAYYLQAQKVRTLIKQDFDQAFIQADAIITPTAPHIAFKIGEQTHDPLKMYLEDIFVTGASLAGLPAISIPCGFDQDMPIGMQLIGKRFAEADILDLASVYQQNTDWLSRKPAL